MFEDFYILNSLVYNYRALDIFQLSEVQGRNPSDNEMFSRITIKNVNIAEIVKFHVYVFNLSYCNIK